MDREFGRVYEELYRRHWWFRARERVLLSVIGSLGLRCPVDILDVGCGNGLFFDRLAEFGTVQGIEIDTSLLTPGSPHRNRIFTNPLGHPEYRDLRFDLILALDVIEHIEGDRQAVEDMMNMLRPGGHLIITVPALMMLWDRHDEINQHYRRYSRRSLGSLLSGKGRIVDLRYFFHLLVAPKLGMKLLNRWSSRKVAQHSLPPSPINRLMEGLCSLECLACRRLPIPFGTSLLAVVEKPAE